MKYLLSLVFFVTGLSPSFAQDSRERYDDFIANKSNVEKAIEIAKKGVLAAKQEGDNEMAGIFSFEMAKIHQKSGDYKNAIYECLAAEQFFKKESEANKLKTTRLLLFDLYRRASKDADAIALGKELILAGPDSDRCRLEIDVASIYLLLEDYSASISLLERRTSKCQAILELKALELLGTAYNNYGNLSKAEEVLKKGAKLANEEGNSSSLKKFNDLLAQVKTNNAMKQESVSSFEMDTKKEKEEYIVSVQQDSKQLFTELSKLGKDLQINKLKLLYVEQEFNNNKLITAIELQKKESALKLKIAENKKQKATIELNKANMRNTRLTILFLSLFILMATIGTLLLLRNNKRQKILNEQLTLKNNQIIKQSELIVAQNKKLDASIDYGRFIQNQLLPTTKGFEKLFKDAFEIQIPLDKVSGDFLWYKEMNGMKYVCLVDCTGHGVPGAILSIIANEVLEKSIQTPFQNLVELMSTIAATFYASFRSQGGEQDEVFEGMDLCLVAIDERLKQLKLASANNGAILVSDGSLKELRSSRASFNANNDKIKTEELILDYLVGDYLYMYTDGYCDQKGGEQNRKYGKQNILELIKLQNGKNNETQKENIYGALKKWQGNQNQIDDISFIGIKL